MRSLGLFLVLVVQCATLFWLLERPCPCSAEGFALVKVLLCTALAALWAALVVVSFQSEGGADKEDVGHA